jgi:4-aminobutyrate aminotransferase-like enzyme
MALPNIQTSIPGPRSRTLAQSLEKYEVPTVTCLTPEIPIFWDRAEGYQVWDVDGNVFVDLTSAFGVASLGHSHSRITGAIRDQTQKLSHAMGDVYPTELKVKLCEQLSRQTFERWTQGKISGQTFLCNSGFEAVEVALKTAHLFTQKRGVLAFRGGYHGLGYGALEVTWREDFKKPFRDQLGRFAVFASYPMEASFRDQEPTSHHRIQMERFEQEIHNITSQHEIGAVLVEPIQGRGGERIPETAGVEQGGGKSDVN